MSGLALSGSATLVGEATLDSFGKNDWLRRNQGRRELRLTPLGTALWERFGRVA
ncbi:hypothetical protein WAB97_007675 [Stenotrophomonas maltophilia]|uniref:hypothetical protein n=1 Tax=Stenotrophomonas maltophilia group TaxID=995085 RepID=UPI000B32E041|nr:hypothetical protein [Stenotrophomonas maltophilia]VEE52173.1 regulatory protein ArsR [Stenotrophomonas maltophilia]